MRGRQGVDLNQKYAIIKAWRERLVADGRCVQCEGMRGDDGTTIRCRLCANKKNTVSRLKTLRRNGGKNKRITKQSASLLESVQKEEMAWREEDARQQERLARLREAVVEEDMRREAARRIRPHNSMDRAYAWSDLWEYRISHRDDG